MTDTRPAAMTPPGRLHQILDDTVSTTRHWWLPLITGVAWIVIAILILGFDYTTVAAIATLFAVFCCGAAATEVMAGAVSSRGWRIFHWLLAVLSSSALSH